MTLAALLLPMVAVGASCAIFLLARWDHRRRVEYWERNKEKKLPS